MDELIFEGLLAQRDTYLNVLKQLDFQLALEPDKDSEKIKELQGQTVAKLKKIEQELAFASNPDSSQ